MDFGRFLSVRGRKPSQQKKSEGHSDRRHLPLIASPVHEDLHLALGSNGRLDVEKVRSRLSVDTFSTTSSGNVIIYKQHHEASTIELFYDLFFVANLAYFTAVHQHVDASSILNYLKLFTLMWFTWLSTILYDVRFSVDSVFNRICKLVHFGVLTSFVFAGPVFDKYDKSNDQRYYKAFAVALFVSRLCIMVQYLVVMWQSRRFRNALLPLCMTAGVYFLSAIAYFATRFVFPASGPMSVAQLFIWFLICIVEGIATMVIAIIWRVISFKYTHLVERMGLLSLIIMGEGIIGMIKSVSCITKGQTSNNSAEYGNVVAAIILLYTIWILYFDQIDHHRFGTIRQQIWAICHFPLHIAILLTVEGQTAIIVWNSVVQGLKFIWKTQPLPLDAPGTSFATSADFISAVNKSMYAIQYQFKEDAWKKHYDWTSSLTAFANISSTHEFKSTEWNNAVAPIIQRMYTSAELFVFQAHKETMDKMVAVIPVVTDTEAAIQAIYKIFDVVTMYFFVSAGGMLIMLAVLYWFGKLHKTKYEFGEIINRTVIGFIIPVVGVVATLTNKSETGFKFVASQWLIPIVLIGFLIVIVLDNTYLTAAYFADKHRKRASNFSGVTYTNTSGNEDDADDDDDDDRKTLVREETRQRSREMSTYSSNSNRETAYEPYDSYTKKAAAVSVNETSPELDRSREPSPQPVQIPVSMIMRDGFRPSHARTRSSGYAVLGGEGEGEGVREAHGGEGEMGYGGISRT